MAVAYGGGSYMADQSLLDVLAQGGDAWNSWREQNFVFRPDLSEANLPGANLSGANLSGATLSRANFSGANLQSATLNIGTRLTSADLRGADLRGANFHAAWFHSTDLSGAVLRGANFLGIVDLSQEQLELAIGDENTRLPDHITPPASWGVLGV